MQKLRVKSKKWLNEKGFTLVELMAVLAILALIVAIAVPAVGSVLAKSKDSAEASSIKLMERAGELAYLDDLAFDEAAPKPESYWVASLKDEGYLKMESVDESLYVTKKGISGEFVLSGADGESFVVTTGLPIAIESKTCEEAKDSRYTRDTTCLYTAQDVQDMNSWGKYILMNDVDLSGIAWPPIGSYEEPYSGVFDGNGYVLSGLTIDKRASTAGLFGFIDQSTLKNIQLEDVSLTPTHNNYAGGLVGYAYRGIVSNVRVSGDFVGSTVAGVIGANESVVVSDVLVEGLVRGSGAHTGGVVGYQMATGELSGQITSTATVESTGAHTGGIVGQMVGSVSPTARLFVSGDVTGGAATGGLFGSFSDGQTVSHAVATNTVTGGNHTGGLVGRNSGTIRKSSHTGTVTGHEYVGGLAGYTYGEIANSYAKNTVTGVDHVGGIVGSLMHSRGKIVTSYVDGVVHAGDVSKGAFVGSYLNTSASTSVVNSYAHSNVGSTAGTTGGKNVTADELKKKATFVGWDFINTWQLEEGESTPELQP